MLNTTHHPRFSGYFVYTLDTNSSTPEQVTAFRNELRTLAHRTQAITPSEHGKKGGLDGGQLRIYTACATKHDVDFLTLAGQHPNVRLAYDGSVTQETAVDEIRIPTTLYGDVSGEDDPFPQPKYSQTLLSQR